MGGARAVKGPEAAAPHGSAMSVERTRLADSIFEAHVVLSPGQTSGLHWHQNTRDTFYVLVGELTVMIERTASEALPYMLTPPGVAERRYVNGRDVEVLKLKPGHVLVIEPGVVHATKNEDVGSVEFLCLEGVGEYTFIPVARMEPSR